jgi:dTDP-4-amino-4,6-dideoxygalactose transaminase
VVGDQEQAAVADVITRGFLGTGAETQAFEQDLSAFMGGRPVACVSSGTAALHLALQACGVGRGDEVVVPSFTFVATFQAISATGAVPVPCEVDLGTGTIDVEDAERRITPRTRAILPVHYASVAGRLDEVYALAAARHLRVIEDAAHAFGCLRRGQRVGASGDVVCFSFDGIKNITSGEGGAVVSEDIDVMRRVRDARLLGVERDTEQRYARTRSWDFDVSDQGYRYHMSDLMAAIGRTQLGRLEEEFAPRRRGLARCYRAALAGLPALSLFAHQVDGDTGIVPHIFPVRITDNLRDAVRQALATVGIETGIHYKPNHLLTKYRAQRDPLPVTEQLYAEILSLPLHPLVSDADQGEVIAVVARALTKYS